MTKSRRYHLLDSLRGLAVISMIIYHAVWDMVYIFGINLPWYRSASASLWQKSICYTFILLSGFCHSLGREKFMRSLIILACSAVITLATLLLMPENLILFGVLTLIGSCMLIMIPLDKIMAKRSPFAGLILSLITFVITNIVIFPASWHKNYFTAYLGFPPSNFASQDYFPLVPWFFLYLAGYFLYRLFKKKGMMSWLSSPKITPLEWIGRHSLEIYMLHQPIIYSILYVIFKIIK